MSDTSVGRISLDLIIKNTIGKQLNTIASQAQRDVQKQFTDVGESISSAIEKPLETMDDDLDAIIKRAVDRMKQPAAQASREIGDTLSQALEKPKKAMQYDSAEILDYIEDYTDKIGKTKAEIPPVDMSKMFKASEDPLELLNQKLDNISGRIQQETRKMAELQGQYKAISPSQLDSGEAQKLEVAITEAEGRLISLQQTYNKTSADIQKIHKKMADEIEKQTAQIAAEAEKQIPQAVASATPELDRLKAKCQAVFADIKAGYTSAFESTKAASALDSVKKKAAQTGQAVSNAFKNTKVGKAVSDMSGKVGNFVTRTKALFGELKSKTASDMDGVAKSTQKAMEKGQQSAKSASSGIGKAMGGLGKSVKSALKSTFLMAGLYAAFRGIQSAISTAAMQNDEFAASLNALKGNLAAAFAPIMQSVMPLLNTLISGLATAAKAVASFISSLFGKTYKQSVTAAKQMQTVTKKAEGTKKAAKEAQSTLAGFDQISVLDQPQDSDSGGAGGGGADAGVDFDALGNEGNAAAEGLAAKFKQVWGGIAQTFKDYVFNPIKDNLYKFDAPIARFKALFATIGTDCVGWVQPLADWFNTGFKDAVSSGISLATTVFSGYADMMVTRAQTIWDALKPLVDWFVRDGLPMMSDAFIEGCGIFEVWFNALKTGFDTLWNGVVRPIMMLISGIILDVFRIIQDLWERYGKTTADNIKKTIETIKNLFLTVWNSFLKPTFDKIFDVIKKLWDNHLKPLVSKIGEFVAKLANGAMEIYNQFIAPIVKWFVETLGPPVSYVIGYIGDVIGTLFGTISDVAGGIFDILGGIIDFITGIFTGNWEKAWNGIKDIFGGVWDSLVSIVKFPVNMIIKALNALIGGLNKIHFDIPDWVPLIGGKGFGFNIPKIPELAKGGIVDQPTLSMVGERGREAVMPLENNTGWISQLAQELTDRSGGFGDKSPEILAVLMDILRVLQAMSLSVNLDGRTIVRLLEPYAERERNRMGTNLVHG